MSCRGRFTGMLSSYLPSRPPPCQIPLPNGSDKISWQDAVGRGLAPSGARCLSPSLPKGDRHAAYAASQSPSAKILSDFPKSAASEAREQVDVGPVLDLVRRLVQKRINCETWCTCRAAARRAAPPSRRRNRPQRVVTDLLRSSPLKEAVCHCFARSSGVGQFQGFCSRGFVA